MVPYNLRQRYLSVSDVELLNLLPKPAVNSLHQLRRPPSCHQQLLKLLQHLVETVGGREGGRREGAEEGVRGGGGGGGDIL